MELVQDFCMSQRLEQTFEKFAIDNSAEFMKALDIGEGDEHPLSFQTIYMSYLSKFEGIIEEFIFKVIFFKSVSSHSFVLKCHPLTPTTTTLVGLNCCVVDRL